MLLIIYLFNVLLNFREYLASFKKTVAMHEVFLCRLAAHPTFSKDSNFRVFLEYENDVSF
jgi:sorting nexin-5/6/32